VTEPSPLSIFVEGPDQFVITQATGNIFFAN
jgi:hypothetical protein